MTIPRQPLGSQAAASLLLYLCPGHQGSGSTLGSCAHMQARGKQLGLAVCGRGCPQVSPDRRESGNCCLRAHPHLCVGGAQSGEAVPCAAALPALLSSALPRSSRHAIKQAVKGSSQAARSAGRFIKETHERLKFGHCKSCCGIGQW